jgi:hypothetical protein
LRSLAEWGKEYGSIVCGNVEKKSYCCEYTMRDEGRGVVEMIEKKKT